MIQLVWQGRIGLGKLAILAAIAGSRPDLLPARGHQAPPDRAKEMRALACNKSRNCPTRRYLSNSARSSEASFPWLFAWSNFWMRCRARSLNRNESMERAASSGSSARSGAMTSFKMSASVIAGALTIEL